MPRPLKGGILGTSTIILSKDIDIYAYKCGSNFYESDVNLQKSTCRSMETKTVRTRALAAIEIRTVHSECSGVKLTRFKI